MSLEEVENNFNSDGSVRRRLREAIELTLNVTLPEVKPGGKYPEGSFEMGQVTITAR